MNNVTSSVSNKIANMSFICACMVVAIHLSYDQSLCGGLLFEALFRGFPRAAVPFFFIASGFFLFGKLAENKDEGGYLLEVKKRVRSLLLPYLLWSVVWFVFLVILIVVCNYRKGDGLWATGPKGWENLQWLGLDFSSPPALGPLWYIRTLMIFVLISPVLMRIVIRIGRAFLVCLYLLTLLYAYNGFGLELGILEWTFPVYSLFYFSLGGFLQCRQSLNMHVKAKYAIAIAVVLFCVMVIIDKRGYMGGDVIRHIFMPIFLYGVWRRIPQVRWHRSIVTSAFAIYCIHPFVIKIWACSIGPANSMMATICEFLTAVLVPMGVIAFLRQRFPIVTSLLLGGR